MEFDVYPVRAAGVVKPKHVLWSGKVRGQLFVEETHDRDLRRTLRTAHVRSPGGTDLLPVLCDAVLIGAKSDWWTMTGWESVDDGLNTITYTQTWILIPADVADLERSHSR